MALGSAIALVAGLVTATTVVAAVAAAPQAQAATSDSQQWVTDVSTPVGTPLSRTLTFGTTGVTATQTDTTGDESCAMFGTALSATGPNLTTYWEPDPPADARVARMSCGGAPDQHESTTTLTFNKPVLAPILHVMNLDASRFTVSGTTTTGETVGMTPLVKNNALEITGNTLNSTLQEALQDGCARDDGTNPNGGCGSLQIMPTTSKIQSLTLVNSTTGTPLSTIGPNDTWAFTLSFPTAPLTKAFSPATIQAGGTSELTFSLTNPDNSGQPDTFDPLDFTDTLPAGLTLANGTVTPNAQCGPNLAVTDSDDAALAAGATSVTASGITLNKGDTCEITVTVTAAESGTYTNDNSNLSSTVANVVPDADTTLTVTQSWQCDSYGYLFQTDGLQTAPHTITKIDLATGQSTDAGETADYVNAVGYNTKDNYFYAWDVTTSGIVRINSDNSLTDLGLPATLPISTYITGDFDDAGHFWITTNASPTVWAEIDYAPGSSTIGQVMAQGTVSTGPGSIPSDWSFIGGTLFGVRTVDTGATAHLFAFDTANPAAGSVDQGALVGPNDWNGAGATYTDGTYLYGSHNTTGDIYRIDPATRQTILVSHGPSSSGNDGARCATAPIPTITVTKTVEGRMAPADQFTVGLQNASGEVLTSATTTGTATTASTTDWPVSQGGTYTIMDAMAADSPSPIGQYTATISCVDGDDAPVDTGGTVGAWTMAVSAATDYSCTVTNTPRQTSLQPFSCLSNAPGMLFQHSTGPIAGPTTARQIEMVTGAYSDILTVPNRPINAVGYNVKDNYVYGWDLTSAQMVRVGSDGGVDVLGKPAGYTLGGSLVGDVDDQGHYWFTAGPTWYEVDLTPGPTFMTILGTGSLDWSGVGADWAFVPGTDALYTVGLVGGEAALWRFDRTTHLVSGPVLLGPDAAITSGAMYADSNGFLYTSNNGNGDIYRVDVSAGSAVKFASGPASSGNDGARCAASPILIDFGDAPDSYGTTLAADGARHGVPEYDAVAHTAPVMLGASIDPENDGQPSDAADGDDSTGAADEDGVTFNPDLGYSIPTLRSGVDADTLGPVANTLSVNASADGFVSVWVDWNEDGDFDDDGEQVAAAQPVTAGDNDVTLTQGENPPGIHTYVRVRYSTDADAVASPTGSAPDGEVEDYRVQVERLITPSTCTVSTVDHYAFTFTAPDVLTGTGGVGSTAVYRDVSVIAGVPVDMVAQTTAGQMALNDQPTNGFGALGDDVAWNVNADATLRYSFYQAGTYGTGAQTPVAINGVFTVNDMDGVAGQMEIATFSASDLADYGVSAGSDVLIDTVGASVEFHGVGNHNGDIGSRFQVVLEGISTFDTRWQGGNGSGFGFDGDGDLSIQPPACSDFGDAPDSYGTTLANDGARNTIIPGLTLGTLVDFDPDGQPSGNADGDDTNRLDDEDGVSAPIVIQSGVATSVTVSVTNTPQDEAQLAGWIDFDGNGTFDADEIATVAVPGDSGTANYTLNWPAQTATSADTYARFRLFGGEVGTPSPTGDWAGGGEVEDYLVSSRALSVTKTSDATAATRMGDTVNYTVTAKNVGGADYTTDDPATLIDDLTDVLDDGNLVGDIEVTGSDIDAAYDDTQKQITWSGPLAAGDSVTLKYSVVLNKAGDQEVTNVAFQPPPCTSQPCDPPTPPDPADCATNDNSDPATGLPCAGTELLLPKLTVVKSSTDLATAQIGDTVHYTITAKNSGQADYTDEVPALVVDDMTGVLDDATFDGVVTVDGSAVPATYAEPQISWTGPLAKDATVTLSYSVVVTGDGDLTADNIAFETTPCSTQDCPTPVPPDPDVCADNGNIDPATGLSCSPVTDGLPKLSITKTSADLANARIGDTITWIVTAQNIGAKDFTEATPAVVLDDLSGALDDATFDGTVTVDGSAIDAAYAEPQIKWSGPLAMGDTATLTYQMVLTGAGDGHIDNVAWQPSNDDGDCEVGDCPAPDGPTCAANDNVDPVTGLPCVPLQQDMPRPQLTKSSPDLATARIGDTVTYTVTFTNIGPGDYSSERPAQFADDLSGLLDDATFAGTVTVDGSDVDATYTDPQIVWTGPVASGDSVTLTYQVVITGAGDLQADNLAYVPPPPACTDGDDCPPPPTPTPPDPDTCASNDNVDPATGLPCVPVNGGLPKLELTKTSPDLGTARIGDTVTFTVTAQNVGERDFGDVDPAEVLDDLAGVLDDATFDGTVTVDGSDVDAAYAEPRISWTGPLAMGDIVSLTYSVVLTGAGDLTVANVAFVPPPPPPCDVEICPPYVPPTPDPQDCASNDNVDPSTGLACVPLDGGLPKLELTKSSPDLGTARIGDTVSFTVTAKNIGERDFGEADPAQVLDDLTGVLDDATFDGTVAVDGSTVDAAYSQPRISWSGPLATGDTVSLTYNVVLTGKGDLRVANVAFVPPSCTGDDCPVPPTPDPQACAGNAGVDPATGLACAPLVQDLRKLAITKSSDASGIVKVGDTVTYTVTVTNVGPGDYTADVPATVVDDLSGVLDDATYNGDAAVSLDGGTLGYTSPQLSWVGPLGTGDAVTITYTVAVTANGDLDLRNTAFAPLPLDADCATDGTCPVPADCVDGVAGVTGQPCAVTETGLPGLYVTKTVDRTAPKAGDRLTFTVTMTNTGNVDFTAADPAVLTDDLSGVLDDGAYNGDAVASGADGTLAYTTPRLTWTGPLAVGATATVTYSVQLSATKTGDDRLRNVASIPDGIAAHYPGGVCPDGAATCAPPSPQAITVGGIHRVAPPASGGQLPNTGAPINDMAVAGLSLLLLGGLLLAVGFRRRYGRRDGASGPLIG